MWPAAIGGVANHQGRRPIAYVPNCGADRSVVDVPTHPTFVECDDLTRQDGSPSQPISPGSGEVTMGCQPRERAK